MTEKEGNMVLILNTIQDAYSETPAERAARNLFLMGIREKDFQGAHEAIGINVGSDKIMQVQNAVRDIEKGFKKRK